MLLFVLVHWQTADNTDSRSPEECSSQSWREASILQYRSYGVGAQILLETSFLHLAANKSVFFKYKRVLMPAALELSQQIFYRDFQTFQLFSNVCRSKILLDKKFLIKYKNINSFPISKMTPLLSYYTTFRFNKEMFPSFLYLESLEKMSINI